MQVKLVKAAALIVATIICQLSTAMDAGRNEAAATRPSAPQALADEVVEDRNRFTVCCRSRVLGIADSVLGSPT